MTWRLTGFLLAIGTAPALAGISHLDGEYRPRGSDWDCAEIGTPGGAVSLRENRYRGIESTCHITATVAVREIEAVIGDFVCGTGADVWSERRILMPTEEAGLIILADGRVLELERCPTGE